MQKYAFSSVFTRTCPILAMFALVPLLGQAEMNDSAMTATKMKKELENPDSVFPIGNDDVNRNGGLVINKSGKYTFCENVYFRHNGPAVTINASDVVIDLQGFSLSGKNHASTGIIASNSSNLAIQNGTIENFTINGININGSQYVTLEELSILHNGNIDGPVFTGGLAIFNSSYIDMNDLHLIANFNFGLGMSGVDTANFINSNISGTRGMNGDPVFGNTAYGIFVSSSGSGAGNPFVSISSNLTFVNFSINNTVGLDSAFGIIIAGSITDPNVQAKSIRIENCEVNNTAQTNVTPTAGILGPFGEGITLGGATGITIKNCTVDRIYSAATTVSGVSHLVGIELAVADNATIEDCSVSNVIGLTKYVHGFDIEGKGNNITFNECHAYNIINNNTSSANFALGFGILKPLGFPGTDAVGTGTVVQNSSAQNVRGPNGATATGLLLNGQRDAVIENNIFNNNDNGILVMDIFAPAVIGSNNLISNNITAGNTFFGIKDSTLNKNNAYYGNQARSNGIGSAGNFSGLPFGTPIVTWLVGTLPPSPSNGFELDNYNIIP